jgi:hypothetical protein
MKNIYVIIILILFLLIIYLINKKLYDFNGKINIDNLSKPNYNLSSKKVAICISGQIRDGYEKTLLLQKLFLIDSLNADVFCCFEETTEKIKNFIENKLNPKNIIYVNDVDKDPKSKISHGTICMYNKIYMANKLKIQYEKDNNFIYDYVIRIRPDLIVKEHLPNHIFNSNLGNVIYMPIISKVFKIYGYPDFMAISNSHNMDNYSNIYKYIVDLKYNNCNISETLLYMHLDNKNIKGILFKYPIQLYRFKYDNFSNCFSSFKYLISLIDRYITSKKCNIKINI